MATKDDTVTRLTEMEVREVSLVDRAANGRHLLITKRETEMATKIDKDAEGNLIAKNADGSAAGGAPTTAKADGAMDEEAEAMKAFEAGVAALMKVGAKVAKSHGASIRKALATLKEFGAEEDEEAMKAAAALKAAEDAKKAAEEDEAKKAAAASGEIAKRATADVEALRADLAKAMTAIAEQKATIEKQDATITSLATRIAPAASARAEGAAPVTKAAPTSSVNDLIEKRRAGIARR